VSSKKQNKRTKLRGRPRGLRRRGRGLNPLYVLIPVALVLLVGGIWLLATSVSSPATSEVLQFPAWLRAMGPKVQRAYAQAVAHREELQYVPCYCGCGSAGHTAVVDCHIANVAADGSITYERHASTCDQCLDVALEASTMLERGVSLSGVRSRIEAKYAKYGPGTDTPPVPGS